MKPLPLIIRRLPYVIYVLAFILGGWRFYNDYTSSMMGFQHAGEVGEMGILIKSSALYWAVSDVIYLVANGAILHVLIAIYDKVRGV